MAWIVVALPVCIPSTQPTQTAMAGHVDREEDGRIQKETFYGDLAFGKRIIGLLHLLRYKHVCVGCCSHGEKLE